MEAMKKLSKKVKMSKSYKNLCASGNKPKCSSQKRATVRFGGYLFRRLKSPENFGFNYSES